MAAAVPGALLRRPAGRRLRRAGEHPGGLPGRGRPGHAGHGHRHPDHHRRGGCARVRGTVAELSALAGRRVRRRLPAGVGPRAGPRRAARGGDRRCCPTRWRCGSTRSSPRRPRASPRRRRPAPSGTPPSCSPSTCGTRGGRRPAGRGAVPRACTTTRHRERLMRPVLLDMDGFASFREPTTVDFTDADYFALVGPTGVRQVHGDRRDDVRAVRVGAALGRPAHGRARAGADRQPRHRAAGVRRRRAALRGRPRAAPGRVRRRCRCATPGWSGCATRPAPAAPTRTTEPLADGAGQVTDGGRGAARAALRRLLHLRGAAAGRLRRVPARRAAQAPGEAGAASSASASTT